MVSPQLKKVLLARDMSCRFPGCSHTKWLDAHHVKHWADGGETTVDNLLLLCSKHHRLLHEGGFTIKQNYEGHFYFKTDQGRVLADVSRDGFDVERVEEPTMLYHVSRDGLRRVGGASFNSG